MKKLFTVLMLLLAQRSFAQSLQDGPYLLYTPGAAVIKSVIDGKALSTPLGNDGVKVSFTAHPDWDFSVQPKKFLTNEVSEFAQPEKLFFISDIEGEFEGFRNLLLNNQVIDQKYNWTFGKGHLVICGDLFDRGLQVPECMWLIYKLESAAQKAGGHVHTILGNHDVMNLSGDLRYVQPKYFESARLMELDYLSLYGPDSELGRWLRTKNTIEKIGDNLCAHAGISPQINKLGLTLQDINTKCRPFYDKAKLMRGVGDTSVDAFFTGETSLFWYRGYFTEPKATEAEVEETLKLYGVSRIVVGHTIVPGNVGFYYGGKVLGLDVNQHAGDHQAALFEGGKWFKVNDKGLKKEQ